MRLLRSLWLFALWLPSAAQAQVSRELYQLRDDGMTMLQRIHRDVRDLYYDPRFRGVDLDSSLRTAGRVIQKAEGLGDIVAAVSEHLRRLGDSHTFFLPPRYAELLSYGVELRFYGDTCFIRSVKPGGSADRAGLRVGERLLSVDRVPIDRRNYVELWYNKTFLTPMDRLNLVVRGLDGTERDVDLLAEIVGRTDKPERQIAAWLREDEPGEVHSFEELGNGVLLWRLSRFEFDDKQLSRSVEHARKYHTLILDLRGNLGGSVETMRRLTSALFDREVVIGDVRSRNRLETLKAAPAKKPLTGRVFVLVDSESSSSAEIFARVIQLEKRGTIIGDRTMGAVLISNQISYRMATRRVWWYGATIATSEIVLSDGQRVEGIGVTPDILVVPTGADIAGGRDPVMIEVLRRVN